MKILKKTVAALLLISIVMSLASCNICAHEYIDTVIAPTCTEDGKTIRECQKCGKVKETDIVKAKGHEYTETKYTADCDSEGYTEFVCHCGYSYRIDVVPSLGHELIDTVTSPSCEEIGYTTHSCSVCGYEFIDSYLSPSGHTLTQSTVLPNCTDEGYSVYTCACGYSYKSDIAAPTGHSFNSAVTPPTCIDAGYTSYSCDCGYSYSADFKKPTGHTFTTVVTLPKCETEGHTTYSCACGFSYDAAFTPPTGHNFSEKITMPTVSEYGYTEFTCACGFSYIGDYRFYSTILDDAYADNTQVLAKGIDISKYNHTKDASGNYLPLNWSGLKSEGVDYVILKLGSTLRSNGTKGGLEPTFEDDYAGAVSAGLGVGVYFYTYATTIEQIRADAEWMVENLDGKFFDYPIYLDLEDDSIKGLGKEKLTEMCMEFFNILQKAGYYTGLYINHDWLYNVLQTERVIDNFEIWYARHVESSSPSWDVNFSGQHLGMWQYSAKGSFASVPNIPFDMNYSYKDYPSIIKSYGFNGFSN